MKCTFYRTEMVDIKAWDRIISKLRGDLCELMTQKVSEAEARTYMDRLLHFAKPLNNKPDMMFFGMDEPDRMPPDTRVDYFYWPSYIATGILMKILMLFPDIVEGEKVSDAADSYTVSEAMKRISSCMRGCTGRQFEGHGYDAFKVQFEVMEFFTRLDVREFFFQFPGICPEFSACYLGILEDYTVGLKSGSLAKAHGEYYSDRWRDIIAGTSCDVSPSPQEENLIFVYGTLMRGQCAFGKLRNSRFLGSGVLYGYAMYDLGNYPGIVQCSEEKVLGEVYAVDDETLKKMDEYEDEGRLYTRSSGSITLSDGNTVNAYFYKYNHSVSGPPIRTFWNMRDDDPVWYACYGSNLSADRFSCYIRGGDCPQNGRHYDGCKDPSMWTDSRIFEYPGRMYFAKRSSSWQDGGVAFYEPEGYGSAVMRLYKITYGQFKDVQVQEGMGWYGRTVCLEMLDGVPVFTFTSNSTSEQTEPGEPYLSLIRNALIKEAGMNPEKADAYLAKCLARNM